MEIIYNGVAQKQQFDWVQLQPNRRLGRALESDKIYAYVRKGKSKNISVRIFIGATIADLLGFHVGDRVHILYDKRQHNYLRFVKTQDIANSYHVGQNNKNKSSMLYIVCTLPRNIGLEPSRTTSLPFEVFNDGSFILDFKPLKTVKNHRGIGV